MKRRVRMLITLSALFLLTLRSGPARQAAAEAVRQAAEVVFPSLFPFFVLSRQLTGSLRVRRTDRLPLIMGLCGGYPLGVYSACELYRAGALSATQTRRLLRYCNNTGPAVFFGMVSALLFPDPGVCTWLFSVHALSAVLTALLLSGPGETTPPCPAAAPEPLTDSVTRAARACAGLCAAVIFFSVLLRLVLTLSPVQRGLSRLPLDRSVSEALVCAAMDLPSGLSAMANIHDPTTRFLLCAGAVGWGGACVHMQAAGIWRAAGLRPRGYVPAKLLQMAISLALSCVPARLLFGSNLPVWPAFLPIFAAALKKAMAFSRILGYNGRRKPQRRRRYAVSKEGRAGLRPLRQSGAR